MPQFVMVIKGDHSRTKQFAIDTFVEKRGFTLVCDEDVGAAIRADPAKLEKLQQTINDADREMEPHRHGTNAALKPFGLAVAGERVVYSREELARGIIEENLYTDVLSAIQENLQAGRDVVWDHASYRRFHRSGSISIAKKTGATSIACYYREDDAQYEDFQSPTEDEGFEKIGTF